MKTLIFDSEFTDLPINNQYDHIDLLELGYIIVDNDLNIISENNMLVNVPFQISDKITELTGIDNEKTAKDGLELKQVLDTFYNDLKECTFIIAHNLKCDIGVVLNEFKKLKLDNYSNELNKKIRLDSYYIFRNYLILDSYRLINIYNHVQDHILEQTHRALDDCYLILNTFTKMPEIKSIQDEYFKYKVSFGKYRMQTYDQILKTDPKYYEWILRSLYKLDLGNKKIKDFFKI